jgi:hypothetical protein
MSSAPRLLKRAWRTQKLSVSAGGAEDIEASKTLPFLSRDAGLSEDCSQQILSDIAPMRIRNPHPEMLSDHELVLPA